MASPTKKARTANPEWAVTAKGELVLTWNASSVYVKGPRARPPGMFEGSGDRVQLRADDVMECFLLRGEYDRSFIKWLCEQIRLTFKLEQRASDKFTGAHRFLLRRIEYFVWPEWTTTVELDIGTVIEMDNDADGNEIQLRVTQVEPAQFLLPKMIGDCVGPVEVGDITSGGGTLKALTAQQEGKEPRKVTGEFFVVTIPQLHAL